jgi:N-acetylglutamate synthase-like GNAT family acetyltransferase
LSASVRALDPGDVEACDAIIAGHPTFFGDPDGLTAYRDAVRTQRGLVAVDAGEVVGFLTLEPSSEQTLEITWMAVRNDRRRNGIGRLLVDGAMQTAASDGVRMLCVLTLGPSDPDEGYKQTRAFYRGVGFVPIKEIDLKSWNDPWALLLARAVP